MIPDQYRQIVAKIKFLYSRILQMSSSSLMIWDKLKKLMGKMFPFYSQIWK